MNPPTDRVELDAAAEVFLRAMRPEQADLIRVLCRDNPSATPADYLLSYIQLADERGESATMISEHLRLEAADRAAFVPESARCAFCEAPFMRSRPGQLYCPDPEDAAQVSCGRQATLKALHDRRPATRRAPADTPAPPLRDLSVYQRARSRVG